MRRGIIPIICLLVIIQGCAFISLDIKDIITLSPIEERTLIPGTKDKILVVEILGLLTITTRKDKIIPEEGTIERLDSILNRARKDKSIKGIILKIDSPGGGVTASELIYKRIKEFKNTQKIPVVACVIRQATSGAYMVALASDKIVALPSSVVGNIGVMIPSISLEGLMVKLGIKNQTITSGRFKDSGNPLREMTQEDRKILEDIVMEFHRNFLSKVAAERALTKEDSDLINDGRIMTASIGLEHHLIDKVGYFKDAVMYVEDLAGIKGATVVVYRRKGENRGGFYSWP
ncbi:MAG: signal peptide peptidase SppA [Deltaproteobacteria bacterium]|nr:signal peptide peptidase SppA [Deltaproteobacteria bacterium]